MFDIGFTELVIIGVVSLLVIGPERLPSAIRTASLWLNRIKRGFNDIKREVEQELHNDAVLQELRKTGEDLKTEANSIGDKIKEISEPLKEPVLMPGAAADAGATDAGAAHAAAAGAGAAHAAAIKPRTSDNDEKDGPRNA